MTSTFRFEAIGTQWSIDTAQALGKDLREAVLVMVEEFDRNWSRFREDSLVTRIARAPNGGSFDMPPEAPRLLAFYDLLHRASAGAVDPLVGRDLERLGYDASYSLTLRDIPRVAVDWTRDVRHEGRSLTTHRAEVLDVGAAGKGLLVDMVAELLLRAGRASYVVDAGGDMRHAGPEAARIGLEHPSAAGQVIGVLDLKDRALCGSGTGRRRWGDDMHHVIDARNGTPARGVIATWVLADDAMVADGVATALFFTPPEALADIAAFEFLRVHADGRPERSRAFPAALFER